MEVGDLERLWQPAGAALAGLAIGIVALRVLRPARPRESVRRARPVGPDPVPRSRRSMPAPGGAMGWPFRRRGTESLRIQPAGADLHVLWRVGETAVAHLVVGEEDAARGLYEWLGRRFGSGAERLSNGAAEGARERVVRQVKQRKPVRRQLAVLSCGGAARRVVEIVDGEVRSAARMVDEAEACELLELLAEPDRAGALSTPTPIAPRPTARVEAELAALEQG